MNIREDLKAFVDGQLGEERAKEVQKALDADPALAKEADEIRKLGEAVRLHTVLQPVVGLEETLNRVRRPAWKAILQRPLWMGLAMVAIAAMAYDFTRSSHPDHSDASVAMSRTASDVSATSAPAATPPAASATASSASGLDEESAPKASSSAQAKAARPEAEHQDLYVTSDGAQGEGQQQGFGGAGFNEGAKLRGGEPGDQKGIPVTTATPNLSGDPDAIAQKPFVKPLTHVPESKKQTANRKIIQNASLDVTVEDVGKAEKAASDLTNEVHGYVANSRYLKSDAGQPSFQIQMRVPLEEFSGTLKKLEDMGDAKNIQISGHDVTTDIASDGARLQEMEAEQESYTKMLANAKHMSDALEVKDRLSQVRQDIEGLKAELVSLKDQSAMSTIDATFAQKAPKKVAFATVPPPDPTWLQSAWGGSVGLLSATGRFLGQALVFLFVLSPIWVPGLLLVGWGMKALRL